jgi:hypothetical protein
MKSSLTIVLALAAIAAAAQTPTIQPQIPTLQVCNGTRANGFAKFHLTARKDVAHSGDFDLRLEVGCDPTAGNGYPGGSIAMSFSLSDSSAKSIKATSIEQMTTTGKHTPTMFINGRCDATLENGSVVPCHFWLLIADNRPATATAGTADVVSVLVVDKTGKRIQYGTAPAISGDIDVIDTAF